MERKTDEFTVRTDEGETYVIYEFTNFVEVGDFENPNAVVQGLKRLSTSDGMPVNFRGNGLYEIVELGVVARRVGIEEQ